MSSSPHKPKSAEARLKAIYRQHFDFVWRSLSRFGVEAASREDLAHEVFIVYFKKYMDYQGPAAESTLLYGIARRVAANHRRGCSRREERERQGWRDEPLAASEAGPEDVIARKDARDRMGQFLATLSPENAEIFRLTQIEGLRAKEVAEIFELNLNTLNTRIRAAKTKFEAFVQSIHAPSQQAEPGSEAKPSGEADKLGNIDKGGKGVHTTRRRA